MTKKKTKAVKPVQAKVDWEKLAKRLQEALAGQIRENDELEAENERLSTELIQASGIIKYLEIKSGSYSV